MEHHADGTVTLNTDEAQQLRDVLDWILRVYQAIGFMSAEMNYATVLGLRGLLGEGD